MKIKKFKCGLCKEEKRKWMTRLALRKHIEKEHRIMTKKFNYESDSKKDSKTGWARQKWIIEEDCE